MSRRTILIMAGGTGGHVFPALAVARRLAGEGWRVVWLGTADKMEAKLVPGHGYEMAFISMSGLRGKGVAGWLKLPLNLTRALAQAGAALFRHRPDVVLGMGGFAAFPGGVMSAFLHRPLIIHEQNAVAGLTNRVLARVADQVLFAFPDAFAAQGGKYQCVGNPVREEILDVAPPAVRFARRSGPLKVLVVGGSLGAQALNEVVPAALARIPPGRRPQVTHQAGERHLAVLQANYARAGVTAELVPFIEDMAAAYAGADLVICRSGALTVAELAAVGVASVLVPFPHAVDDHQTANADYLVSREAAWRIPQQELQPERLAELLGGLSRLQLQEMAERARAAAQPEATEAVAAHCRRLAGLKNSADLKETV